jgi:hypothetical protein
MPDFKPMQDVRGVWTATTSKGRYTIMDHSIHRRGGGPGFMVGHEKKSSSRILGKFKTLKKAQQACEQDYWIK